MIRTRLAVTKQTPLAPHGLVAAEHPLGAEVGVAILARGGNAVDAAVATALAMTVVEPFMSTIAGAGTMVVHVARDGETHAVDFNACAPRAAHEGVYRVVGGVAEGALFAWPRVADDANMFGPRSVAVPGSIPGLALALERFGTMTWADALAPAIALARDGFVADWYVALSAARYLEELSAFPETARTYLRNGRSVYRPPSLEPGDRVRYPDLAASLSLIAREGPEAFTRGPIADAIDDLMRATGGLLGREDLGAYRPLVRPVLWTRYRDVDLAFPPGATGGITAVEILNVLEQFAPSATGWSTAAGLDRRARAVRRAFADRLAHLGDPDRIEAPWERLASKAYAREVAAEIRRAGRGRDGRIAAARSDHGARSGRDAGATRVRRAPAVASHPAGRSPRAARTAEECTTHVSVVDRHRNMVSLTHTAVSLWGSRMVVPGTGILLNNAMMWFDPEPGKPNSVGSGKRGLCNMTPVLGFRRGRPLLAMGAPGGRRIVSAIPQVLATLIDGGGALQAAVEAPRLHAEDEEVLVDDRVGPRLLADLERRGHRVVPREETYATLNFAKPVGIRVTSRGLEAGLDPFRPAAAAGH